jgi:hypothetical protein
MELLYFDFDHGTERLLFVRLDREAHCVHFRFEKSPDPVHDEEIADAATVTVNASTACSSPEQFSGFCLALVSAMRDTPFSLQDPGKTPFAARPQATLRLDGIGEGVSPEALTCRMPPEIAAEIVNSEWLRDRFRALTGPAV